VGGGEWERLEVRLDVEVVHQVSGELGGKAEAVLEVGEVAVGVGLAVLDNCLSERKIDRGQAHKLFQAGSIDIEAGYGIQAIGGVVAKLQHGF
jgi:hypothetical protein